MKNEFTVTRKLLISWARENARMGKRRGFFIFYCIFGSLSLLSGTAVTTLSIIFAPQTLGMSHFLMFFVAAMCFYRAFLFNVLVAGAQYKSLCKTFRCSEWTRTIEFTDDGIFCSEETSSISYTWDQLVDVKEKDKYIIIFFSNGTHTRLYKDAFVGCTADECLALLTAKKK